LAAEPFASSVRRPRGPAGGPPGDRQRQVDPPGGQPVLGHGRTVGRGVADGGGPPAVQIATLARHQRGVPGLPDQIVPDPAPLVTRHHEPLLDQRPHSETRNAADLA
jgi:hypothetical protein